MRPGAAIVSDRQRFDRDFAHRVRPTLGKRLAPEYETAATALVKNDPPVALAKVDCTIETKTCTKYGVSGYPSEFNDRGANRRWSSTRFLALKIFKNGEVAEDYNGPREAGKSKWNQSELENIRFCV